MPNSEKPAGIRKPQAGSLTVSNPHQRKMITRLRRVEGQLRGIQGMIGQGATCEAVAQQTAAARRALDRAFFEIIACALEAEIEAAASPAAAKTAGVQVSRILAKYG